MKIYKLYNHDGCYFAEVETTSFAKAREYFKSFYNGNYYIYCESERKNIRI